MGYTKYCQDYSEYTIVNRLTNHLEHKLSIVVKVDWSGPIYGLCRHFHRRDRDRIPVWHEDGQLYPRPHPHVWVLRVGGTRLICDNLKTDVVSHPREGDVVLTADYEILGSYYQTAIMLAGICTLPWKAQLERLQQQSSHSWRTRLFAVLRFWKLPL